MIEPELIITPSDISVELFKIQLGPINVELSIFTDFETIAEGSTILNCLILFL